MMSRDAITFALIYFTFFLDNVLLTALVPIVPELLGEDEDLDWSGGYLLNSTTTFEGSGSGSGTWAGLVLGAKAAAQLVCAPLAGAAARRRGPRAVLRAATALLAAAAAALCVCAWLGAGGSGVSAGTGWGAGALRLGLRLALVVARAAQGAGAAGAGVAGLAEASRGEGAVGALLGAVALGVLVGYPLGGAAYALWSRAAPFQLAAAALLLDLALQCIFFDSDSDEFDESDTCGAGAGGASGASGAGGGYAAALHVAREPPAAAVAGAVLLTTCVMAALEPCLPVWLMHRFHPQRWARGAVFVPDSLGYLAATSLLGGGAFVGRGGWAPERLALAGQVLLGGAALALPLAPAAAWLALPHAALGAGLGAADAALVPALLAARPRRVTQLAALLQAASSAAYALGPALGALLAGRLGFAALFRLLGVANLAYAAWLGRHLAAHPLSPQWGAPPPPATADSDEDIEEIKLKATALHAYATL